MKEYKIIVETFLLDFDNNNLIIDKLFQRFLVTINSINKQTYRNFIHIVYVNDTNEYLINKIKKNNLENFDNVYFHYYNSQKILTLFPEKTASSEKEGLYRGNNKIRNYLKNEIMKKLNINDEYLLNVAIDDDDYFDKTHFYDINFYSTKYLDKVKDKNFINLYFENCNIYYVPEKKLKNVITNKYMTGNKILITKNLHASGYNILETPSDRYTNIIIRKPNSTWTYMRWGLNNNRSNYYKSHIIKSIINEENNFSIPTENN